ncbi:GDP polyribonucleotidyltransferase [Actinidia chinensis var. chinensis]|uniref:GDP polyribonucleotidyltransferase n=1 Tax=Actinidia chinensis var. chinensis TaxID=1590841 RepID=A0A2R6PK87_ACTCC|nr:GDP polyribonucleotidyltransferase [Actinidia chinensis var. chinensis]
MQSRTVRSGLCNNQLSYLFHIYNRRFRHLCSRIRWLVWTRPRPKVAIRRFGKLNLKKTRSRDKPRTQVGTYAISERPIRVATFNVAMFSLAPAIPKAEKTAVFVHEGDKQPKSILKQSPLHQSNQASLLKSNLKVSINLPDNEISLAHNNVLMRSPVCFPPGMCNYMKNDESLMSGRSIMDVLSEVDADILALQDVRAEEEKNMQPLSDLARGLGMKYVFAESWAPEYGNAIFSRWPIKRWRVQKIYDDQDFRNVLRATIDVPRLGEVNFCCTQLDHLDENWRMKQINAIIQSNDGPHILAGGLNSLDGEDYSLERWSNIVKYYEEIGKPTPKVEVMKFLKGKGYIDAKGFAGECEPVVIVAKGQNVQGTCKYGTRVDYILASPDLNCQFVPGSYSVVSSKGTSDHHIVTVEVAKAVGRGQERIRRHCKVKDKVVRITKWCSS